MPPFSVGFRAPSFAVRGSRAGGHVLVVATVVAASLVGGLVVTDPAGAAPTLTLTPTATVFVVPNSSVALSSLAVSGDTTDQLQVTLASTIGTLTISTTTGLTLGYGNSWTGTSSVTFTGLQSDINAGLASATLVTSSTTGTAAVGLTAMVAQSGFDYLASNQHFYEYVACAACTWTASDAAARTLSFEGQPGYLSTIPSGTVNSFISTKIANATNVWFGARAYESNATDGTAGLATVSGTTYRRVWRWTNGASESPIAGNVISECTNNTPVCSFANSGTFYSSWASGEPNNSGGTGTAYQGEYVPVTNWGGTSGAWNDLPPTNNGASGYVVEFGGKTNTDSSLGTGFAGVVTVSSNVLVAASAVVASAPSITVTAADSSANVSWTPPPSDGGSAITSYQISTDGGGSWVTATTTTTTATVNGNVVTTIAATAGGLTNGTSYNVEVRAINGIGNGAASSAVAVTPAAVPNPPTAVIPTRGNGFVGLTWTAPTVNGGSSITGYTATAAPSGLMCSSISATSCTIVGLTNGTAYTFTVHATNGVGNSEESVASASATPATTPNAPTSPVATRGNGFASVAFTAPGGTGGTVITGYTATASPGGATASCSVSPCIVTGLTNGTAYTFTVHATNAVGNGSESGATTAVTPATVPDPPTALSATRGNGSASIAFTAPAGTGGTAVTGYTATAAPGGALASCSVSPCVVSGLANGTSYTFTVHATNAIGNSTESSVSPSVTPATVPDPPSGATATRGAGSASIAFTVPPNNGGDAIVSYRVTASPGGANATCATSPCVVTGLTNGTAYSFTVHATNTVGNSSESSASGPVTPATVPDAPTGPTATRGNGSAGITWTAPANTGGATITAYTATASPGGLTCTTSGATTCAVSGLANGTSYTFTVHATNAVGSSAESTPTATVTPATVPDAPGGASAVAANGSATVSFIAPIDSGGSAITGYSVTASPGGQTCDTTTATSCVVTGLANGTVYTFTVHATNAVGNSVESPPSIAVTPATVPDPPTSLSVTRGNGSASVNWLAPANNGGSAVTGYTVTASPVGSTCTTSGATSCIVTGLANGSAYTFSVFATNSAGDSTASSVSGSVTPATVPDAPTNVAAGRGNGAASVSWTPPASVGGDAITGYTVTVSPGGASISCAAGPCVINGLVNGTAYTFTVHATNSVGDSVESSASNAVTPAMVPDPPTGVSAISGNGTANVGWSAPASDGGSAVSGYTVTAMPGGKTCVTAGAKSCTVTGLANGTAYAFSVYATNSVGDSIRSGSVLTMPATVPDPPTGILARSGNGSATVSWTAPANGGGQAITGYAVTTSPGGAVTLCSTSPCVLAGVVNGTAYTFTVHATNAVGNSAESSASNATTPATVPDPPTGVSARAGSGAAMLSWKAAANSGGYPIIGYVVIVWVDGVAQSPLYSPGAGVSFAVDGLADGTAYTFTVASLTTAGASAPSAESSPVTPVSAASWVPTGGSTAATPSGSGYWSLDPSGGLSNHGDAANYGAPAGTHANDPVVAINSTTTGHGYWLASAEGRVLTFGDAHFYGSMQGVHLNQPIVGIARTPDDRGYWLVGSDGGVFTFGNAHFYGSLSRARINGHIVAIAVAPHGHGYWLVSADGGVFTFGNAKFYGAEAGHHLNGPVVGIAATPDGHGYLLVASDGGVFTFGDARFHGSLGATGRLQIVGIIADDKRGYRLIIRDGTARAFRAG